MFWFLGARIESYQLHIAISLLIMSSKSQNISIWGHQNRIIFLNEYKIFYNPSQNKKHSKKNCYYYNHSHVFGIMNLFFFNLENPSHKFIEKKSGMQGSKKKSKVLNIDDIIIRLKQTPVSQDKACAIREGEVEGICSLAKNIMLEQPMLLELNAPVQICGDTHGQYHDLLNIFKLFGQPDQKNYLFLGDYVDRGKQSLECILLLLAYKIKHPLTFFLLRGNHQSTQLNKLYGFFDQCKRRLTLRAWKVLTDTFNCMPVAAVVGQRIFCVHGGLSPQIKDLSILNTIRRPVEMLDNKIISDILWSDPKPTIDGWSQNAQRGVSYYYGKNAVQCFLKRNDFDLICRSHQVVEQGYQFCFDRKLVTIFSAPNYCGQFSNLGALVKVGPDMMCKIQQYEGQPAEIKKRNRSVTPIRYSDFTKENNSPLKQKSDPIDVKTRKATKIFRANLQRTSQ